MHYQYFSMSVCEEWETYFQAPMTVDFPGLRVKLPEGQNHSWHISLSYPSNTLDSSKHTIQTTGFFCFFLINTSLRIFLILKNAPTHFWLEKENSKRIIPQMREQSCFPKQHSIGYSGCIRLRGTEESLKGNPLNLFQRETSSTCLTNRARKPFKSDGQPLQEHIS